MSAYDDNPRAQARAILRMDGADLRTRNEEELATLSSKCLTTWTRAIIRGMKGGTGFKAGNAQRRGCGDNTQDGGLAPPSLVCSFRAKVALERLTQDKVRNISRVVLVVAAGLPRKRRGPTPVSGGGDDGVAVVHSSEKIKTSKANSQPAMRAIFLVDTTRMYSNKPVPKPPSATGAALRALLNDLERSLGQCHATANAARRLHRRCVTCPSTRCPSAP